VGLGLPARPGLLRSGHDPQLVAGELMAASRGRGQQAALGAELEKLLGTDPRGHWPQSGTAAASENDRVPHAAMVRGFAAENKSSAPKDAALSGWLRIFSTEPAG
jgi:hypothetical protein